MFHALSDQLYGDQTHHKDIRARVIEYMREESTWYKSFLSVNTGGGTRRNPKRKNAGGYASTAVTTSPTEEEIDAAFEQHLAEMARGGTYGDHTELNAFSNAYGVDIKIWQSSGLPWLSRAEKNTRNGLVLHVALHTYEHYSSVRNITGPHTGLPNVRDPETYDPASINTANSTSDAKSLSRAIDLAPWKIQQVRRSLAFYAETEVINKALLMHNGEVLDAVSYLMEHEDESAASSPGSSSVEREQESEDEAENAGARKKQDRRQSRATKAKIAEQAASRPRLSPRSKLSPRPKVTRARANAQAPISSTIAANSTDDEEEYVSSGNSRSPRRHRHRVIDESDSESEEPEKSSTSNSTSSASSPAPPSIPALTAKLSTAPKLSSASATPSETIASAPQKAKEPYRGTAKPSKPVVRNAARPPTPTNSGAARQSSKTRNSSTTRESSIQKSKPGAKPNKKLSASQQKDLKKRAQKAAAKERKQGLKGSAGNSLARTGLGGFKGRQSPPTVGLGSLLI